MGGINFIESTAPYLNITGEHYYENGVWLSGSVGNLNLGMNEKCLTIKDGSICKWHLGDNWQTMGRSDTQRAIEQLSDTLHLPLSNAVVTRVDIAQNFIVKHPPGTYLNHLGVYYPYKRLVQPDSLYYNGAKEQLVFYDKAKEQRQKREVVPSLYIGRNTLRYEQRYKRSLPKIFKVEAVRAGDLYNERFYSELLKRWRDSYRAIKKINNITINFDAMRGIRDMNIAGRLLYIEQMGGELAMLQQITDAQKRGELSKRQADELKRTTRETCKERANFTEPSDAINELNKKVDDAVKLYR